MEIIQKIKDWWYIRKHPNKEIRKLIEREIKREKREKAEYERSKLTIKN